MAKTVPQAMLRHSRGFSSSKLTAAGQESVRKFEKLGTRTSPN